MSTSKKELTKNEKARVAIAKWDKFVEDTFALTLAHGTKKQKNISANSNREMKELIQASAAEMKALFRKYVAAEMAIVEQDIEGFYEETYKAIVKDDLR